MLARGFFNMKLATAKHFTVLAGALSVTTFSTAQAADVYDPATNLEWYVGIFGGGMFADTSAFAGADDTFGIAGGIAGVTIRQDTFFYGLEADFGGVFGGPDNAFCGSVCDANWKAHVRGRVGISASMFDVFVAGGLAIAELDGGLFGGEQTRTGWSIGGGVEAPFAETLKARVEVLYDDFGSSREGIYNNSWSDLTVRGAIVFNF